MYIKTDMSDINAQIRKSRNQGLIAYVEPKKETQNKIRKKSDFGYKTFEDKYSDMENAVENFTPSDLVFFFRAKAKESGVKYIIANMKRDLGVMKKALDNGYSASEVCLMIEFLFCKEQGYLTKDSLQPTILISKYCNTIYKDSLDWANDCYKPKTSTKPVREWNDNSEDETKIGKW